MPIGYAPRVEYALDSVRIRVDASGCQTMFLGNRYYSRDGVGPLFRGESRSRLEIALRTLAAIYRSRRDFILRRHRQHVRLGLLYPRQGLGRLHHPPQTLIIEFVGAGPRRATAGQGTCTE